MIQDAQTDVYARERKEIAQVKHEEMNALDLPEAYEALSPLEKEVMAAWIALAMEQATKYSPRTSYGIKHDFEMEGFYITNGQLKGAMLAAGYQPENAKELNWTFPVKPRHNRRGDPTSFSMGAGTNEYRALFAQLEEEERALRSASTRADH
jgi:hypothetical protein